ncbi:membrane protein [Gordonia spumicola]|uniref:Membrane protein n=1 Tax=Gordonia spumicola TaxID=589161 RepID=A0A7I9V5P6_9ACTN|nr:low temperature requirement protein A [Gordonia spumicola]GEE00738.1 membrane protein [Gordonia spumicola]
MRVPSLGRARSRGGDVATIELFFDLVYVFAFSQLAAFFVEHLTGRGAIEMLVLFGGVWWVWNYTAWATNFVDPERTPVRILLVVLMLLSLVMAAAIPEAFGDRGPQFAITLAAIQVIRPLFIALTMRGQQIGRNYAHLLAWSAAAAAIWVIGAFCEPDIRLIVWAVALAVDVAAPMLRTWLPGLGGIAMSEWKLTPAHLAERNRLIFIIALGETVLSIGREFLHMESSVTTYVALCVAFLAPVSYWWLYFAHHSERTEQRLEQSDDPTALARGGFAYAHAVLVAGVIVTAVGTEKMLAHPHEDATAVYALLITGGPALYFAGLALFVASIGGLDRYECVVTAVMIASFALVGTVATAIGLELFATAGLTTALLVAGVVAAAWHHRHDEAPGPSALTAASAV